MSADRRSVDLNGLRVLALLAGGRIKRTRHIVAPLDAGVAKCNWHVEVVCAAKDRPAYQSLAGELGIHIWPNMLERQSWEDDEISAARVDSELSEAERISGVPTGRLVLAGDTSVGTGFLSGMLDLNVTPVGRRVVTDNSEPFRIIRRLFYFADKTLEASAPNIVFTHEWAKPWLFAMWLAAQRRGVPCVAMRRSKIRSDHGYVTSDALLFNALAQERALTRRHRGEPISHVAKAAIHEFRDAPRMIKHIEQKWQSARRANWLVWHARAGKAIAGEVVRRGRPSGKSIGRIVRYNRQLIKEARHSRFFRRFDPTELQSTNYIYFPMHKETDLPLNFQAAAWCDQRNTVRLLASMLLSGYRTLGAGTSVQLWASPERVLSRTIEAAERGSDRRFRTSQFKYIMSADLVVTENGSAGWEGLMLGRRVLTLGRTFYEGAGLAQHVRAPDDIGSAILDMLGRPAVEDQGAYDHGLGCMIDAEYETTFPIDWDDADVNFPEFAAALNRLLNHDAGAVAPQSTLERKLTGARYTRGA